MSFFKKPETQVKINSSKSIYTPKGMHQILVNLMDETYNKIQLKKIELNKTGTEIIEECLILSMDFLDPKLPVTADKKYSDRSVFPKEGKEKLTVNLDTDTSIRLATLAKKCRMSRGKFIEELINEYGEQVEVKPPPHLASHKPKPAQKHAEFMKDQAVTSAMKIEPAKKITGKVAEKKSARISNGCDVSFNIETNVPPPSGVVKSGKAVPIIKKMQKTLRLMKSEDSVVVPNKELSLRFQKIARAKNIVIRCRRQEDNTYRCWRI